jgi:hypothetical protein
MSKDQITPDEMHYDQMAQEALRGVVKAALQRAASPEGIPGAHHFYVSFKTTAAGVSIPSDLLAKFPEEMTIVLQHQFWDMKVTDDIFEVGLSFGGLPEKLIVPFDALTGFWDPSVDFGLKFEMSLEELEGEDDEETQDEASSAQDKDKAALEEGHTASVVSLDAFRKKT